MPKKLHERFLKVDPHDRESYTCSTCEKIRAICKFCDKCSEHCQCEFCDLCGLPNGIMDWQCLCFSCDECHKMFEEDKQVVDDFNYANPNTFDPTRGRQLICPGCYKKREDAWKKSLDK